MTALEQITAPVSAGDHRLPGGDHEIVVGHVRDVGTSPEDGAPPLYWRGAYLPAGAA